MNRYHRTTRFTPNVALLFAFLLAMVLPSLAWAQSNPDAGIGPVFLPLVAAGDSSNQVRAAALATDLFLSEYIEGSSFNKAIEIFNATGAVVDLSSYTVELYSNGAAAPSQSVTLGGSLANNDVYVLAHASADPAILAVTDLTNSNVVNFNGDDAVVLRKSGAVVDVIGQVGFDPGAEWGGVTADNTIRRKVDVCAGDTNASDAFNPAIEWDSFALNTFDGLGSHTANCSVPVQATVINELLASTTGTDVEYIELYGAPDASLAGLSLVYVESNNSSGPGAIEFRYDFAATTTLGANGFYLLGTTASLQSIYGVTPNADIATNSLENSSATAALVETASLSGSSVSGGEVVLDAVGITDATASTFFFSAPVVGPDGTFFPAGVRRVTDGVDTDSPADWVISDFNLGPANTPTAGTAADVAPTVSATSPAAGATGVPVGGDISVTFSESVDLAAGAISVECPVGASVASNSAANDVTSVTINPASDLPATTGCAIVINPAGVTDNDGAPDALAGPTSFAFTTGSSSAITLISAIQGSGPTAAVGAFTVEAIVVGDYQTQGSGQLRGFFLQEEDADADADPATSEGIFVFCSSCPTAVSVGDKVRVTGASSEFFTMSQLTAATAASVTLLSSNNSLPTPAIVQLPVPALPSGDLSAATAALNAYFEPFEGMLVTFPDTLAVSEYFELARYGQIILTEGGRPRQFTDANTPTAAGLINHEIDLASRTIILDDTDNRQNRPVDTPNTAYYHPVPGLSTGNFFRGGDTITNLTGVLHWSFAGQTGTDAWRIRPVTETFNYAFTPVNPRPAPPTVGGSLKVASFNVLNYFLTIDTTAGDVGSCGASISLDCRGADSAQELDRQRAKLTQALLGLDADVVGLIEMENTPGVTPQQQIVDDLNAVAGVGAYAYIDTGVIGTDAIRVGLIYKPGKAAPVGNFAVLDSSVDPNFIDTRNRPALAQTFAEVATGARFTVVVNHLKSKGSGCGAGDDDTTTGQGNCNGTRTLAAQALAGWLATDPTGSGDPDVLIIGDLNSYAKEDPIVALQSAGYTDLVALSGGPNAYSYLFDGQLGYLDHALANASLAPQVNGVTEWHINADEIPLFDYNDDVRDTGEGAFEEESDVLPLHAADAFRTSDHDPVLVGLALDGVAPTASPTQAPAANGAGWNNSDVTVTWNWTDSGSGIDPANCTASSSSSGEGVLTLTATCRDQAGNSGTTSYVVNVDKTAPVVAVTGVSDGASYAYGSVPVAACDTQDATSGVAGAAVLEVVGGDLDGIGSFTATCSSATDNAGNSSSPVSVSYTVLPPGTLVGACGNYRVYSSGGSYIAPGWSGAIKVGTNSRNTLNGSSGADLILGLAGNDLIRGNGGDDVLCGGDGVDFLLGYDGNDRLEGGEGSDVLNGGDGDYDQIIGGAGNDALLDGDGVLTAQGGAGDDLLTIALRNGWRDGNGQPRFAGLAAGYNNDLVTLLILNSTRFLIDITGDERDVPPSAQEGNKDKLILLGVIDPASMIIKFEHKLVISADDQQEIPDAEAGARYLSEPVGEDSESAELLNRIFLPLLNR